MAAGARTATSPITRRRRHPYSHVTVDEVRNSTLRVQDNNPDTVLALAQRTFGAAYQFVPPMSVTLGVKECLSARKVRLFSRHRRMETDGATRGAVRPADRRIPDHAAPGTPGCAADRHDRHGQPPGGRAPGMGPGTAVGERVAHLPGNLRYEAMIGTGGIGSGDLLRPGRATTRWDARKAAAAGFLDRRDYCKLHIVSHYVRCCSGPVFTVILVGKVGDDEVAQRLLIEMREAGLDRPLRRQAARPTDICTRLCFIYPDGSGGNLTTNDSACAHVGAEFVAPRRPGVRPFRG